MFFFTKLKSNPLQYNFTVDFSIKQDKKLNFRFPMPPPRKALVCKRPKLPELSESERTECINKLKAIKTKHAPKALALVRKALYAVKELRTLENEMSQEATAVNAHYNTVLSEFKLTFEVADSDLADEMDHEFTGLEDCEEALEDVYIDALAACPEELAD